VRVLLVAIIVILIVLIAVVPPHVRAKLEALAADKANVDPGADELARIFVRFLKCVVWFTANFEVEAKVTLNGKHLRSVIRCFGGLPNVVFDEGVSEFFDNQLAWIEEHDTFLPAKAAAPKAAAPQAAPKAVPDPAPPAAATPSPVAEPAPAAGGSSYDDLMADITKM
jgi:hypothetical protein